MKNYIVIFLLLSMNVSCKVISQVNVNVQGKQLYIDNQPYTIKGICYHPVPIGQENIRNFGNLKDDLALMVEAGINTIRVYEPIEELEVLNEINEAGIKVIMGFGYNQGGKNDILSGSFIDYVNEFKHHKAILFWELGNEYNYHPDWFEGDIRNWYKAMNDAAVLIHQNDSSRPVATAHGELPDALALSMSPNIDIWGLNIYRWDRPEAIYKEWDTISTKPMYLSEAGADSYMTINKDHYQEGVNEKAQADATSNILKTVFEHQNSGLGVTLFSFTDGWWKAGDSASQNVGGSAPNSSGVPFDGTANEEYWGIVDIHRNKKQSFYVLKNIYLSLEKTTTSKKTK